MASTWLIHPNNMSIGKYKSGHHLTRLDLALHYPAQLSSKLTQDTLRGRAAHSLATNAVKANISTLLNAMIYAPYVPI